MSKSKFSVEAFEEKLGIELTGMHPRYIELVAKVYDNVGDGLWEQPASSKYHQAHEGGLIEHLREVFKIAMHNAELFPSKVNKNILGTSALLHDVGKYRTYKDNILKSGKVSTAKPYIRTAEAKVLEHLYEGGKLVTVAGIELGFPASKITPIEHCIASHHGETRFGWGSIINPNSPEAWILHLSDMMSARIAQYPENAVAELLKDTKGE